MPSKVKQTVSVVIPAFNRAREVAGCVESVLAQADPVQEIVIVDDGSVDETPDVCRALPGPVKYVRQENAGVAAARNRGALEAEGDWLAFLDTDDLWYPEKTSVQLRGLEDGSLGWAFSNCHVTGADGQLLPGRSIERVCPVFQQEQLAPADFFSGFLPRFQISDDGVEHDAFRGDMFELLFYGNVVIPSSAIVRRDLFAELGGFDISFRLAEETEFFHRLAARAPGVYTNTPLLKYRTDQTDSLTTSGNTAALVANALKSVRSAANLRDMTASEELAFAAAQQRLLVKLAYTSLSDYERAAARRYVREAWRAGAGLNSRTLTTLVGSWLPRPLLGLLHRAKRAGRFLHKADTK